MDQFDFEYLKFQYGKENLSNVFNVELDLFPSVKTNKPSGQRINLYELFQKIRSNLIHEITPTVLLTNKYVDGENNDRYGEIKETLPVVCYNATFRGSKSNNNVDQITNLMFLEIDDLESKQDAEELKLELTKKYKWIVACYHSLSKLGLHLIIAVDAIHSSDDFKQKYEYINEQYFNDQLDANAKRLTQYTILPFDPDIYVNENPSILQIDKEVKENQKGASTGNKKKKIITSTCTFSSGDLNHVMNIAARDRGLRFIEDYNLEWDDPNMPIYYPEGIDVVEVKMFLLFKFRIKMKKRNKTIGKLSMKLIYLNQEQQFHDEILKFVVKMNQELCDPPLTHKEVLNSFESNWKKHQAGELDFSSCFIKRRIFWSPECTLTGREKQALAAKLIQGNRKQQSLLKIELAIEDIFSDSEKITQKKVKEISGLSLRTIKNYWDQFKAIVKEYNLWSQNSCAVTPNPDIEQDIQLTAQEMSSENDNKGHTVSEIDMPSKGNSASAIDNKIPITIKQVETVYHRVYKSFPINLDANKQQELLSKLFERLNNLPQVDANLLIVPIDEINDSSAFWKRSNLESSLWDLCNDI